MLRLPRRWNSAFTVLVGIFFCGLLIKQFGRTSNTRHGPRYHPIHTNKLPSRNAEALPNIQFTFPEETEAERNDRYKKRLAVKETFVRSWDAYKELAWGFDELRPVTGTPATTFGGWGATLVDSLDTLWIMGMKEEFEAAVEAVTDIDFTISNQTNVNIFETTIRYLGGLIGAYDVTRSAYPALLAKAVELGDILYQAFDTPQRIPVSRWDWLRPGQLPADRVIVAELGSLTLEFTRLSEITGDSKYYDAVYRVMLAFEMSQEETRIPGLWPTIVDARRLAFSGTHFTIGGMSDSLYEYLTKEYILLGGTVPSYRTMYEAALDAMKKFLFFRPNAPDRKDLLSDGPPQPFWATDVLFPGSTYVGSDGSMVQEPLVQHLGCFAGGMVALAAKTFHRESEDMAIAKRLVDGCIWAYDASPLGIMPELFHLATCDDPASCIWDEASWLRAVTTMAANDDSATSLSLEDFARGVIKKQHLQPGFANIRDHKYLLRPEAIESIFILYRITGEKYLLDAAWGMFNSIAAATWTKHAYAAVADVTVEPGEVEHQNTMESFWLAETLKYFYLIFSEDDLVSLDEFVL